MPNNNYINNSIITKAALAIRKNTNNFVKHVDRQYESQFASGGAKIGATINVRLPNDNIAIPGAVVNPQAIQERSIPLTIDQRWNTSLNVSTQDRTLNINDFAPRYIAPSVNVLVGSMAANVIAKTLQFSNLVRNTDANNNTITPSNNTWLRAGALLDECNAPRSERWAVLDPWANADTVTGMAGMFNPTNLVSKQNVTGMMDSAILGVDGWMTDQTVIIQQTGSYDGTAVCTGAVGQNTANGAPVPPSSISSIATPHSSLISCGAIKGTLNAGDIITIGGVNRVNRINKNSRLIPQQFVVLADCANGSTSIPVSPALIGPAAPGVASLYQTVDAMPTSSSKITLVGKQGEVTRRNFLYHKSAVTVATVDLEMVTGGVVDCGRDSLDGISLRTLTYYDGAPDLRGTRMDILYGSAMLRGDWGVIVPTPMDN